MKILVIDDKANDPQHSRKFTLEMLKDRQGITFELILPTMDALSDSLRNIADYDLIIVDYRFDKPGIFRSGASLYSLLRDYTVRTPIYLISVMTSRTNQIGDFDLFINDKHLEKHEAFKNEIEGHIALQACKQVNDVINILCAPAEVEEDLEIMLKPTFNRAPKNSCSTNNDDVISSSVNGDLNIHLFHWLIQSLLYKEGPLVSREGASLLLGISIEYFESIVNQFEGTKYSGIFSESLDDRWWGCLLEDHIFSLDDPEEFLSNYSFREAAAKLLKANSSSFSLCVNSNCGGVFPDSLGVLVDDETRALYPVHVSCSEFNEALSQEPFFRNPRLIEGD